MKVIVLMAGFGKRFLDQADKNPLYKIPKPFIPVFGRPMVCWATSSISSLKHRDFIFIALKEHDKQINIKEELRKWYGSGYKLVLLPKITRGNAETVLYAKRFIKPEEEVIIMMSDDVYKGESYFRMILKLGQDPNLVGVFPIFKPKDNEPKWCFVLQNKKGEVLEIGEKDSVLMNKGALAMAGTFYFPKSKILFDEIKKMIKENDMTGPEEQREFYLTQIFNRLLKQGKKIKAIKISQMWGLGTPADLEYFLSHYSGGSK